MQRLAMMRSQARLGAAARGAHDDCCFADHELIPGAKRIAPGSEDLLSKLRRWRCRNLRSRRYPL